MILRYMYRYDSLSGIWWNLHSYDKFMIYRIHGSLS